MTSSYDELAALHRDLDAAPRRPDWPYVEPCEASLTKVAQRMRRLPRLAAAQLAGR